MNNIKIQNGSKYTGEQTTSSGKYKLKMTIDSININHKKMCGTFKIYNLLNLKSTYNQSNIDTYNLNNINNIININNINNLDTYNINNLNNINNINNQNNQNTQNNIKTYFESVIFDKYVEDKILVEDFLYWEMFPEWRFDTGIDETDYLFIKIKELFILPDPLVKTVNGASIDGFYYCCYYKKLDCFKGHYVYENSCVQVVQSFYLDSAFERTSGCLEYM